MHELRAAACTWLPSRWYTSSNCCDDCGPQFMHALMETGCTWYTSSNDHSSEWQRLRSPLLSRHCAGGLQCSGNAKVCSTVPLRYLLLRKKRKKEVWVKDWQQKREDKSSYAIICKELIMSRDEHDFRMYVRMLVQQFYKLLELISPVISKGDACFRQSISAG